MKHLYPPLASVISYPLLLCWLGQNSRWPMLLPGWVLLLSLMSWLLYGLDKKAARKQQARIRERTLHTVAILGGWPGAWLGQQGFRHKTRKAAFARLFWCCALINVILTVYLLCR